MLLGKKRARKIREWTLVSCAAIALVSVAGASPQRGAGSAKLGAPTQAITVPWQGLPGLDHQIWSGGTIILQGTAVVEAGCSLTAAEWDPGDGSGFQAVPFANPRAIELAHTYNAADGTPFVATLRVTDDCGTTASDTFRVRVVPKTLDSEVNVAIDHGLWNLHKRINLNTIGTVDAGYWTSNGHTVGPSASVVLAMEVQGHIEAGDASEDPYVDDVARGLVYLSSVLLPVAIGNQAGGDPDENGNGIGLQAGSTPIYEGGQVMDAFVASGTPNAVAVVGDATWVMGRTYKELVQDMADQYSWGQTEAGNGRGGWRYGWNSDSDNSAAQWWGVGCLAAERSFNCVIPQFVKDENINFWIPFSQTYDQSDAGLDGKLGYTTTSDIDVNGMNTTPSGVVQMILDGVQSNAGRFEAAEHFMVRNWTTLTLNNRIYGMFAVAKSMRLASPAPIEIMTNGVGGTLDWYSSDTTSGDAVDGLARILVSNQQANGSWDGSGWVSDDTATSWAVVILSSTIFQPGPVAVCSADPDITGMQFPVEFDGTASYHLDGSLFINSYEWDFESDGVYDAVGPVVMHNFPANGTYQVTLRVRDNSVPPLIDTDTCEITVQPPPFPPNADPGGPYHFCMGENQPFLLDGTGSLDIDGQIVSYGWEFIPQPIDNTFDDATQAIVDVDKYFKGLGPGTYDVGLQVYDDLGNPDTDYTTVTVYAPGNCPPPPQSGCGQGEPLVITGFPKFSELDGSQHDNDGAANGVLMLNGLTFVGQSYLKIDVPSAEFIINGDLVMGDDGTMGNDSVPDYGPDISIVVCGSILMTDRSVIRSRGNLYGGHIKLCAEGDILLDVSAGVECNGFDLPQGMNGGQIDAYAGGRVQLNGYLTFMTVQSVEAGTIHIAACSPDADAVRVDGRLLATGHGQNGTGGEIYIEARNGGAWVGGIDHCAAIGAAGDGMIHIDVETAVTPWYAPNVAPPAVVVTDGPDKGPCECSSNTDPK